MAQLVWHRNVYKFVLRDSSISCRLPFMYQMGEILLLKLSVRSLGSQMMPRTDAGVGVYIIYRRISSILLSFQSYINVFY